MDRLAARLADGQKPLRKGELADLLGCSVNYIRKLEEAGTLTTVHCTLIETRVPVQEAARLAREMRLID